MVKTQNDKRLTASYCRADMMSTLLPLGMYQLTKIMGMVIISLLVLPACTEPPVELAAAKYNGNFSSSSCEEGSRSGGSGITNDEISNNGIKFNVRTPSNYDQTFAHPLLVVYPPAGRSRRGTERFTGLTNEATAAGFIVVYSDHRPLSRSAMLELATIPDLIAEKWCVDRKQIFFTGHSDGGTVSMGLAFLEESRHIPAAIAPSAAGIKGDDLATYDCPQPISVMIIHSAEDTLFPGYGAEAANWWASCNQCDKSIVDKSDDGCLVYSNCANGVSTLYCEGRGSHGAWPGINTSLIKFFSRPNSRV